MTNIDALELIKEALAYAEPARATTNLTPNSTLSELGISSITALEMAGYIEEKLGVHFPDDELSQVNTIEGFDALIRRYTKAAPQG